MLKIFNMAKPQDKIKASTQEHLDIDDITDDLVILKNGWVALALSTTAVNFDILSEAEQDATIYAYGAFLNSLTFPVQVLIRSKKADITVYYQHLVEAERNQSNPDLKIQIRKYREFVQSTVQQKTILDKRFYLVIHFTSLELGVKSFKKTDTTNKKSKVQLVADAKSSLFPKRDHIIKQTSRLGLFTKQMTTQELIELFYDIYNPAPTGTQRVILNASSYTTPLVEPDLEVPTPAPEVVPLAEVDSKEEPVIGSEVDTGNLTSPAPESQVVLPRTLEPNPAAVDQPIILPTQPSVPQAPVFVAPVVAESVVPSVIVPGGGQADALSSLQEAIKRASTMSDSDISNPTIAPGSAPISIKQ